MITLLKDLASTRSGITVRTRVQQQADGSHCLIQFRDIDKDRYTIESATPIDGSAYHKKHILQVGDILFTAKGVHNKAILYQEEHAQQYPNAFALSIFTVIRVEDKSILPEYLAWFINSSIGQNALEPFKNGTVISSVSNKSLQQLPVTLPNLEKQRAIIQLIELLDHEETLHLEIIKEKRRLINQVIYKKIQ